MLPQKHVKDLRSSRRRKLLLKILKSLFLFLSGLLLIGPLLHELVHILILELENCFYRYDLFFSLRGGFRASIKPLCALNEASLLLFYISGYLITLIVGSLVSLASMMNRSNKISGDLLALSSGILISVLTTIGTKGDIHQALKILGVNPHLEVFVTSFIAIGVLSVLIQSTRYINSRKVRKKL